MMDVEYVLQNKFPDGKMHDHHKMYFFINLINYNIYKYVLGYSIN